MAFLGSERRPLVNCKITFIRAFPYWNRNSAAWVTAAAMPSLRWSLKAPRINHFAIFLAILRATSHSVNFRPGNCTATSMAMAQENPKEIRIVRKSEGSGLVRVIFVPRAR